MLPIKLTKLKKIINNKRMNYKQLKIKIMNIKCRIKNFQIK